MAPPRSSRPEGEPKQPDRSPPASPGAIPISPGLPPSRSIPLESSSVRLESPSLPSGSRNVPPNLGIAPESSSVPSKTQSLSPGSQNVASSSNIPPSSPKVPSSISCSSDSPNLPSGSPDEPAGSNCAPSLIQRWDNITKSESDKREYRALVLPNRMKVLLVSDCKAEISAAAAQVNVGYYSDPDELAGLAHFCEHMLFMGIEKYPEPQIIERTRWVAEAWHLSPPHVTYSFMQWPAASSVKLNDSATTYYQENGYEKFLSEHGGTCNAGTGADYTIYYFSILPDHLGTCLDIFAQFFISPLFTESATERELNAVDSEHQNAICWDGPRLEHLSTSTATPGHPSRKFGTGNRHTLATVPQEKGIDVRQELLKFHRRWYSANIMSLTVIGKESLDELEAMVVPLFLPVKDSGVEVPAWPEHPFPSALRKRRTYCEPIADIRQMKITFPIPDINTHYPNDPSGYLRHLVGHEGPGSLLSALKNRGWCTSLWTCTDAGARGFAFFEIEMGLTEAGAEHTDDIVGLTFQDYPTIPMEDILVAWRIPVWCPELIKEILDMLTPENIRVLIVAKCFAHKCTQVEPWYGTRYLEEDIEPEKIKEWQWMEPSPEFHMPLPNEFIPSRIQLETTVPTCKSNAPAIVRDTPFMRLWFKQDNEFLLPKASIEFELNSPLPEQNPRNSKLTELWTMLVEDSLQEATYTAGLAGLSWYLASSCHSIVISIDGFDDKQHLLLELIAERFLVFKPDPTRFAVMKDKLTRELKNKETDQPYEHAFYQQDICLSERVQWTNRQLLDAVEGLTPEMLQDFVPRFLRSVYVEGIAFGNLTKERALKLADIVESRIPKDAIPLLAQELLKERGLEIEKGGYYIREIENTVQGSSCAQVYLQVGVLATRDNVLLELVQQVLREPCFDTLRTKEQLGYCVWCMVDRAYGVQGLTVTVQGDWRPSHLEQRIDAFLHSAQDYLEEMSEAEFVRHRTALAALRAERPKQIYAMKDQMWTEIVAQTYNFERAQVEVDVLNTISKEELIQFYKKHISGCSPERRKLSVHVVSAKGCSDEKREADKTAEISKMCEADKTSEAITMIEADTTREADKMREAYTTREADKARDVNTTIKTSEDDNTREADTTREANHMREADKTREADTTNEANISEEADTPQEADTTDKQPTKITDLIRFKSRRRVYPRPAVYADVPPRGA